MECKTCHQDKAVTEFQRCAKRKSGYSAYCKACTSVYMRAYIAAHKLQRRKATAKYRDSHRPKLRADSLRYWRQHKTKILTYGKEYYRRHKLKYKRYHQQRNKDPKHKARKLLLARVYRRNRCQTDPEFKLGLTLRRRLWSALKGSYKIGSAIRDLGCTIPELRTYLERKFKPGMTWSNHGSKGWHIDHIVALHKFDLTDRTQLLKAVHYTNLQPLWAHENYAKDGGRPR